MSHRLSANAHACARCSTDRPCGCSARVQARSKRRANRHGQGPTTAREQQAGRNVCRSAARLATSDASNARAPHDAPCRSHDWTRCPETPREHADGHRSNVARQAQATGSSPKRIAAAPSDSHPARTPPKTYPRPPLRACHHPATLSGMTCTLRAYYHSNPFNQHIKCDALRSRRRVQERLSAM